MLSRVALKYVTVFLKRGTKHPCLSQISCHKNVPYLRLADLDATRRREDGQAHCRGDLSRRRPGSVGSGIRRPPALVSMHESPQFPCPSELPQEWGPGIGNARQAG